MTELALRRGLRPSLAVLLIAGGSPASLQTRYDAARDIVERSHDAQAVARARGEIATLERLDGRPRVVAHPRPLPPTWRRARVGGVRNAELSARLATLGRSYEGWAGFWVHDLGTGRVAGWNSDARFPAASTVKLGALAAGLRAYGPRPERSHVAYDLRQLAAWSSNLAANRIVELVGYGRVQAALRGLGMRSSTYPGPYRAGTSLLDAPKPPPHGHTRVTTAHDLGRALYALQAAAAGNRFVQRRTGLTRHAAEVGLAYLRGSIPVGANAGLLRPWLHGVAVAEKNGWLSDTRITAAILYRPAGPVIVVVEVYRPGLSSSAARGLGRAVVRALGL